MKNECSLVVLARSAGVSLLMICQVAAVEVTENTVVSTVNGNVATFTGADEITIASGRTLTFAPASNEAWDISGVISGAGNVTIKGDMGGVVGFSADNAYSGLTTVSVGKLVVNHNNALGTPGDETSGKTIVQYTSGTAFGCLTLAQGVVCPERIEITGGLYASSGMFSGLSATCSGHVKIKDAPLGGTLLFTGSFEHCGKMRPQANSRFTFDCPVLGDGESCYYNDLSNTQVYYNRENSQVKFPSKTFWSRGFIYAGCDWAFKFYGPLSLGHNGSNSIATFDLQGHDVGFTELGGDPKTVSATTVPVVTSTMKKALVHVHPKADNHCRMKISGFAGICWAPQEMAYTLTFDEILNDTKGDLIISNGTVKVAGAAAFSKLDRCEVSSGAHLEIATACQMSCASFYLDGVKQAAGVWGKPGNVQADYTSEALTGDGLLVVEGAAEVAMWTGLGQTAALSDGGNWKGGIAPDLSTCAMKLGFVDETAAEPVGGFRACLSSDSSCSGLVFNDCVAGFFLDLQTATLHIGKDGILTTRSDAQNSRTVTIGSGSLGCASLKCAQSMSVGENDVLVFESPVSGNVALTKIGGGALTFRRGLDVDSVLIEDGKVFLEGVTNSAKWFVTEKDYPIDCQSATSVNVLNGKVSGSFNLTSGTGQLVLNGGFEGNTPFHRGTITIATTPVQMSAGGSIYRDNGGTLNVNVGGNVFGNILAYNGGQINCGAKYAFNYTGALTLGHASGGVSVFNLGGYDQGFKSLSSPVRSSTGARSTVMSDGGLATFRLRDGSAISDIHAQFTGGAGIALEAGIVNLYNESMTTGIVEVADGTFNVCADAVWASCSTVVVTGGVLNVSATAQLGCRRSRTSWVVGGAGKVDLAEGLVLDARSLSVDGKEYSGGWFGGPESDVPPSNKLNCFTGKGRILVPGRGMILMVR